MEPHEPVVFPELTFSNTCSSFLHGVCVCVIAVGQEGTCGLTEKHLVEKKKEESHKLPVESVKS